MSTKSWSELKDENFTDEQIDEIRRDAALELVEMELGDLRRELGVTQEELASRMDASQSQLSKIENGEDYYLSTLRRYIEALGATFEVCANIEGRRISISV